MTTRPHQLAFVELVKSAVPSHINLAEEVAAILNLSSDSAYRRLRGETDFSLEEVVTLCHSFSIPLSDLTSNQSSLITFRANDLSKDTSSFTSYLKVLYGDLQWIRQWKSHQITYAAEDLPVFYHFFLPSLARFKMVYWNKSILANPKLKDLNVEDVQVPSGWLEEVPSVRKEFLSIPSTEIWHEDTLKSTIKQIEYYVTTGYFNSKDTIKMVVDDLFTQVEMLKNQAKEGKKFNPLTNSFTDIDYTLYVCNVMIGNNCVFLSSEGQNATYLSYNSFNFIQTKNNLFNEQTQEWLKNIIYNSELISSISERRRNQYFSVLTKQIEDLQRMI